MAGVLKRVCKGRCVALENGFCGLNSLTSDIEVAKKETRRANANRILYVADCFRLGLGVEEVADLSKIDKWFLCQIYEIIESERSVSSEILRDEGAMRILKSQGFSDKMLSLLLLRNNGISVSEGEIYKARQEMGVVVRYEEVDTCAAEFEALTPYLYSTIPMNPLPNNLSLGADSAKNAEFSTQENNAQETIAQKVLIIGGGPNRIGQGIEFDYCCVHSSFALKDLGIQSIMYNCNPETVSTDYDTSDTLYFEPIDFERVRAVVEREKPDGIIVHFGGQTPLKLAKNLTTIGAKIIGTKAAVIDTAEDREKFAAFAKKLNLNQPQNGSATSKDEAFSIARKIGYPALVRPSYVLGGRAMRIVQSDEELNAYMDEAVKVSEFSPVLVDKFLDHATELDVDAICDGKEVYIGGIMQHIEEAGVHSGDSASCLPPFGLDFPHD